MLTGDRGAHEAPAEKVRGIARANPVLVYGLGLCPALAVTGRLVDGLAMGLIALIVLVPSALAASLVRSLVPQAWKLTVHLTIVGCIVTVVDVLAGTYLPAETARLGIYLPLVAVNCAVLGQLQEFADRTRIGKSLLDALLTGAGFLVTLAAIALIREVLGHGTVTFLPEAGFTRRLGLGGLAAAPIRLAAYPAGALIILGYLKGLQNWIARRRRGDAQ